MRFRTGSNSLGILLWERDRGEAYFLRLKYGGQARGGISLVIVETWAMRSTSRRFCGVLEKQEIANRSRLQR